MAKRIKTSYPGIYYREAKRRGGRGLEKVYYVVFKKDGKTYEEKVGRQYVDNMTPAKAAGIRAERIENKRPSRKETRERERALREAEKGRWTVNRLWEEYKSTHSEQSSFSIAEGRFRNYISPHFGGKELREILALDVDRLRINLMKTKAPMTVKCILEILRRMNNFATKKNLCPGLAFKVQVPKAISIKTEDLTSEQLSRLLQAIEEDTHPQAGNLMKLVLLTGMRRGELLKLQWKDIDFERGFILIRGSKSGRDERIPLNDATRALLEGIPRTDSPYIFPGPKGKRRLHLKAPVRKIRDRAGLPKDFRPLHGLRHAYASMLASSGQVDMYALQKLLTHKSPLMTQRYAHLRDSALKRAANLAGQIIEEAANNKKQAINLEDHKE